MRPNNMILRRLSSGSHEILTPEGRIVFQSTENSSERIAPPRENERGGTIYICNPIRVPVLRHFIAFAPEEDVAHCAIPFLPAHSGNPSGIVDEARRNGKNIVQAERSCEILEPALRERKKSRLDENKIIESSKLLV